MRKKVRMMTMKIIDVSKHQGTIDWAKVKGSINGVIIRCGYGDDYTAQDDPKFKENVEACIKYDIPFGVYIYSYAKTLEQAKSEARHVLRLVAPYKGKLSYPIYLDLEQAGTETGAKDRAIIFGDVIEGEGYVCGIYANQYWWNNYLVGLDKYTKWVARYSDKEPEINGAYDMWQYTSDGTVNGISGKVDISECYRDFPNLIKKTGRKTNEEIAYDIIHLPNYGGWGVYPERKIKLIEQGYDYETIQSLVNTLVNTETKKSNEEIAKEVVAGKWGNGNERKTALTKAGYDYTTIQSLVNKQLKG